MLPPAYLVFRFACEDDANVRRIHKKMTKHINPANNPRMIQPAVLLPFEDPEPEVEVVVAGTPVVLCVVEPPVVLCVVVPLVVCVVEPVVVEPSVV
jgi:hypothetical protein